MGYARIRAEDIIVQMILDDDNATTPMIANLLSSTIT
jgi:hypothetical protein